MVRRSVPTLIVLSTCLAISGVLQAESFLVDNLNNSGAGSLREAIASVNANPGSDTIEFEAGLSGTIVLGSSLTPLIDDVTISGPGAEIITISGNSVYQPFFVSDGSTVSLSGLTISGGRSDFGGGIGNEGSLTVSDCALSNNYAEFDGGAIDNLGGTLVVSQCTLSGNTAEESGAGISNAASGTVSIIESTLAGNTAGFSGGAVDNQQGIVAIVRSTLSANSAQYGGAVENVGTLTVRNSTLSGNAALTTGGGIDNFTGEATVEFATLTGNSAGSGGGIWNDESMTIKHSLVVNTTLGGNCFNDPGATLDALGVNFANDASCAGFTQATAGEINLGPLADNGGPSLTHALLTASVAIDAALGCTLVDGVTPLAQDQRGETRPVEAECDSGAIEGAGSLPGIIFRDGFESQ